MVGFFEDIRCTPPFQTRFYFRFSIKSSGLKFTYQSIMTKNVITEYVKTAKTGFPINYEFRTYKIRRSCLEFLFFSFPKIQNIFEYRSPIYHLSWVAYARPWEGQTKSTSFLVKIYASSVSRVRSRTPATPDKRPSPVLPGVLILKLNQHTC